MTLLMTALAFACVYAAHRAVRRAEAQVAIARECVATTAALLAEAECAWADRHRTSVAWEDGDGEARSGSTLCDIVRARVAIGEALHGLGQG
jgi:hypothetical protein